MQVVDHTEDARVEHQAVKHRLRQLHEELERLERNLSVLQDGLEAEEETLRDTETAVRVKASELESLQQHILLAHDQHHSIEQRLGQRLQHLHAADACISAINEELQSKLQGLEHVFAEVDAAVAAREHEIARGMGVGETLVMSVSRSLEALAATAEQAQQAVAQQVGRNWSLARQTDALVLELQMLQDQTQEVTDGSGPGDHRPAGQGALARVHASLAPGGEREVVLESGWRPRHLLAQARASSGRHASVGLRCLARQDGGEEEGTCFEACGCSLGGWCLYCKAAAGMFGSCRWAEAVCLLGWRLGWVAGVGGRRTESEGEGGGDAGDCALGNAVRQVEREPGGGACTCGE